jgi:hypothetical protein
LDGLSPCSCISICHGNTGWLAAVKQELGRFVKTILVSRLGSEMGKLIPGKLQYKCKFWVFDTQCVTKKFSTTYIFPARQWKKYDLAKTGPNQALTQLLDLHGWSLTSSTGFPT